MWVYSVKPVRVCRVVGTVILAVIVKGHQNTLLQGFMSLSIYTVQKVSPPMEALSCVGTSLKALCVPVCACRGRTAVFIDQPSPTECPWGQALNLCEVPPSPRTGNLLEDTRGECRKG